jgi:hypothetical protein
MRPQSFREPSRFARLTRAMSSRDEIDCANRVYAQVGFAYNRGPRRRPEVNLDSRLDFEAPTGLFVEERGPMVPFFVFESG